MRGSWRKKLLIVTTCMVALLAVVIAIWRWSLASGNNRTLADLRRAGIPTNREELNEWYARVPAEKNAAPMVIQAMEAARVRPPEVQQMKLLGRRERLTNAAVVKAYVETNQATLDLIKTALERPQCRYAVNFLRGPYADFEHLEPLRNLSRLVDCAALIAAERGASSQAVGHISSIVGLARTLEGEPILLSQLVRIVMLNSAARRFERSLSLTKFSDADFTSLAGLFREAARTNCLVRGLIGERAMILPLFRAPTAEMSQFFAGGAAAPKRPGTGELIVFPLMKASGYFERDLRLYLEAMDKQIILSYPGPPQSLAARDVGKESADEARRKYCILAAVSLPALSRTYTREAEGLALVRMAFLACAIERFANAKGSFPTELSELVPAFAARVEIDPCAGQPLRYKRRDDGYLLYSVGADQRDDGGTEIDPKSGRGKSAPEDVVFKVQRLK